MDDGLSFFVVFDRPADFPRHVVVREQVALLGKRQTAVAPFACVHGSLREAMDDWCWRPDCTCRNHLCGHAASRHIGSGGACVEPDCPCGPGGWQ